MTRAVRALTAVFWAILAATVGWIAVATWDYAFAAGLFGEGGSRLVTTLLLAGLVLSSGALLLHHRRSAGGDEEYWTGWEMVYAAAMFVSLFYGIYSFFGWFFYA